MLEKLQSRLSVIDQQLADNTNTEYKKQQLSQLRRETAEQIHKLGGHAPAANHHILVGDVDVVALQRSVQTLSLRLTELEDRVDSLTVSAGPVSPPAPESVLDVDDDTGTVITDDDQDDLDDLLS